MLHEINKLVLSNIKELVQSWKQVHSASSFPQKSTSGSEEL